MINEVYLKKEHIASMKRIFKVNTLLPSIKLERFLSQKVFSSLHSKVLKASYKKSVDKMHYSYSMCSKNIVDLNTKECRELFSRIIGKKVKKVSGKVYLFSHKDYTLIHDENPEKPGYDVLLDFTMKWNDSWGGNAIYSDGMGNSNSIGFYPNTCTVIYRKKGINRFFKYVNNLAGRHKRYVYLGRLEV